MKRLALVPWMVLAGAAYGQVRSADVLYTYRESIPQKALRLGDECFVSSESAQLWGWTIETHGDQASIKAEGQTISVPLRTIGAQRVFPLRFALKMIGADSEWTSGSDTLRVFSALKELVVQGGKVHASAPLAFRGFPFLTENNTKISLDLTGVRLASKPKGEVDPNVTVQQVRPSVVRISWPAPAAIQLPRTFAPASELELDFSAATINKPIQVESAPKPPAELNPTQSAEPGAPTVDPASAIPIPTPPAANSGPAGVLNVSVANAGPLFTDLKINAGSSIGNSVQYAKPTPDALELTLPSVNAQLPENFSLGNPAVKKVLTRREGNNTVVRFEFERPMGAEVNAQSGTVTIHLLTPNVGNGKLAGKVVIVDAGHGGTDSGAHSGGVSEKDLTLSIAKQLSRKMAEAGATVVMTRDTDVFIPLMTRSEISNKTHADFFISCHINSTGGSGTQSGTITFHHKGNPTGKLLAECIQGQIAKVNGLPNLGVWADSRIYTSGFSVLRHTLAPAAVLIEMGFINSSRDRKRMVTADFQSSVTTAVVKGVRQFLGESISNE